MSTAGHSFLREEILRMKTFIKALLMTGESIARKIGPPLAMTLTWMCVLGLLLMVKATFYYRNNQNTPCGVF